MNASRSARNPSSPPFCTEANRPLARSFAAMEWLACARRSASAPPSATRRRREATPLRICSSRSCCAGLADGGRKAPRSATTRVRVSCQPLTTRTRSQMATARRGRLLPIMQDGHDGAVAAALEHLDALQPGARARQRNRVDVGAQLRLARRELQLPCLARAGELYAVVALELRAVAGQGGAHACHQRAQRGLLAQGDRSLLALGPVDQAERLAINGQELVERRLDVLRQAMRPFVRQASVELERAREQPEVAGLDEPNAARRYRGHLAHQRLEIPALRRA